MKIKLFLITITAACSLGCLRVRAQSNEVEMFSNSKMKAAENFMLALGIDKQFDNIKNTVINNISTRFPEGQRAVFTQVMTDFMAKYFTWDNMKVEMEKIYASELSEDDLNALATFFKTPAGQHYGAKMPDLLQKSMLMGQKVVIDHEQELLEMFKQAQGDPPTTSDPATKSGPPNKKEPPTKNSLKLQNAPPQQ